MIVAIDFIGYWLHRAFHGKKLWPFHAIHYSSVELNWLSAARVHPVNDVANKSVQAMIVIALGYAPMLLAGALPFFTAYAIFLHANVSWDFGSCGRCWPVRAFIAGIILPRKKAETKTLPGCCRSGIFSSAPTTCRICSRHGSVFTMQFPPICSES